MTEDEMVRWHHRLNRHEFEQTPEDSEGQGRLACCSPCGHKELNTTEHAHIHMDTRGIPKENGALEDEMVDSFTNSMDMNLSKLRKIVKGRETWHAAVHGVAESDMTERMN